MLTAYSFPFVNLSLAGTPKDFILFALCLWETCSWRDYAPETLRAAGREPRFGCVLPHGVLVYLPTLLWVFSAQLAASLLCITTLLAITTQSPAKTRHDDHDNTLSCERRERCWKPAHNMPPFFFQDASLLMPVRKKKFSLCMNVEGRHCSLYIVTKACKCELICATSLWSQGSVLCPFCLIHVAGADWLTVPGKSAREAIKMFQQYWNKLGGGGGRVFISLLNKATADPIFS